MTYLWLFLYTYDIYRYVNLLNTIVMQLIRSGCICCICSCYSLLAPNPRPQPHLDLLKWRWSWSIWTTKNKMQSGRTPPAQMWRNAGWVSTTAILLPHASTLPLLLSATASGDTQEMAHSTATKRKDLHLDMCRYSSGLKFRRSCWCEKNVTF